MPLFFLIKHSLLKGVFKMAAVFEPVLNRVIDSFKGDLSELLNMAWNRLSVVERRMFLKGLEDEVNIDRALIFRLMLDIDSSIEELEVLLEGLGYTIFEMGIGFKWILDTKKVRGLSSEYFFEKEDALVNAFNHYHSCGKYKY